ncbi:asparagine synthase (glutamine-hydrolyzing) [Bradyrhizobium tunisiense]|uniref:asparagine synthase (glutamine-hydrolyzing) n=1 Tax=Bradyrhizobium tunisiense TaxID=3278709 RepID=UPI0035D7BC83
MCGIFAMLCRDGGVTRQTMADALEQLKHRGPDGRTYWIDGDKRVGLGHARLAIIDLLGGEQPLASEDGTVHVVVNGEFYDYQRVRRTLEERGHRFGSRTDSEILVHLWEDHGTGAIERLRGEFAFVLWDSAKRILLAARDRFGVKPLYYAVANNQIWLASEAKALFAAGVPARWDQQSFFEMCHLYYPQGRTLFAGISQVPPGHYLIADEGDLRIVKYWDLDYPRRDAPQTERLPAQHAEALHEVLDEAIRLRLHADVPVACYLSGGLDSSALLGMASTHASSPIHAFTVAFNSETYDESLIAAETARFSNAHHHVLSVTSDQIVDNFADAVWHSETINPNTNGVAKYLLSKYVRDQNFKVVITGEGADETAAGYDFLARDILLYGSKNIDRRRRAVELRGPGVPAGSHAVSTASIRERLGFVPSWVEWFAEAAAHSRALWSPHFLAAFAGSDPYRSFLDALDFDGQLAGREPVHQSLYLWNKSMFLNLLLNQLADRMEMAHGIEGRMPYLDERVASLLRDMPPSVKIRASNGKHVLREAARPFITETVYRRRKQPFLAPPPSSDCGNRLNQMLQDLLRSNTMAQVPFFDQRAIIRFLDDLPHLGMRSPQAREGIGNQLVYLASACVLQQRFALAA